MSKICIYHKADFDGICSAAIVKYFIGDINLVGIDYSDMELPLIRGYKQVFIVDFSLSPNTMEQIYLENAEFIWIDHHKTAIEANDTKYLGKREVGKAACEICWEYFSREPMPRAVRLLGRYDVWDHSDPEVLPFQYGLRTDRNAFQPLNNLWPQLFRGVNYIDYMEWGELILAYQDQQNTRALDVGGYRMIFDGHCTLVCNTAVHGSRFFKGTEAPLYIAYNQLANKQWKVSLYSDVGIDCGALAKKHGGGGHAGAAGFTCEELPWI